MEGGDISNETPQRWLIVFEGLLGNLPIDTATVLKEKFSVATHQWKKAAGLWEIDKSMVAYLWDAVWRWGQPVDVITYLPEPYAEAMEARLDRLNVPTGNFRVFPSAEHLASQLAFMPNVLRVVYAAPARPFLFGGRGLMLTGPEGIQAWTSKRA